MQVRDDVIAASSCADVPVAVLAEVLSLFAPVGMYDTAHADFATMAE